MANSEDPNQIAPSGAVWSGYALFAYGILSETFVFEILGHLPYIQNTITMKIIMRLECTVYKYQKY